MVGHPRESEVRTYSRHFPVVFDRAAGSCLYDTAGRRYWDLFCGAGALNYGHNEPGMKRALLEYLERDGVIHSLDMATTARNAFLDRLQEVILAPRGYDYRVQFTGPTGANAIEAALKLARKVTQRAGVVAFTRGYHGLSLGALAATANSYYRDPAFGPRTGVSFFPFEDFAGDGVDSLDLLRRLLLDDASGLDLPAAVLVETIQGEGGVHVASVAWLRRLAELCREFGILLIVDDIQVGCGRSGEFFSFEAAGLTPDIVVLSKSISGYGLPMAINLIRPDLDIWKPGEHTGTFRGNNAAFVTAAAALRFWSDPEFTENVRRLEARLTSALRQLQAAVPGMVVRGRGLIQGLDTGSPEVNRAACAEAFRRGLILETSGGRREVVKLLPALTMSGEELDAALAILAESFAAAAAVAGAFVAG